MDSHSHGVKDLVISCIDYRFRPRIAQWIAQEFDGQADLVAVAGAAKSLLDKPSRQYVLGQIEIGIRLHGIERVHIVNHIDCGAYGGSKVHESEDDETAFHARECEQARQLIQQKFPHVTIYSYALCFDRMISCQPATQAVQV